MTRWDPRANIVAISIASIVLFVYLVLFFTFQVRNPLANEATFFTHPWEIVTLQKLEGFQIRSTQ